MIEMGDGDTGSYSQPRMGPESRLEGGYNEDLVQALVRSGAGQWVPGCSPARGVVEVRPCWCLCPPVPPSCVPAGEKGQGQCPNPSSKSHAPPSPEIPQGAPPPPPPCSIFSSCLARSEAP